MITIKIPLEKEYFITPQQTYDIISAAIEDAYDDGFINEYVFYRSLFAHMLVVLNESDEEIAAQKHFEIHLKPLEFWYNNLEDIDMMIKEHQDELQYFEDAAINWIKDYTEYAYSLRGLLDNISKFVAGSAGRVQEEYDELSHNEDLKKALKIAEDWGFERVEENEPEGKIYPIDSLIKS